MYGSRKFQGKLFKADHHGCGGVKADDFRNLIKEWMVGMKALLGVLNFQKREFNTALKLLARAEQGTKFRFFRSKYRLLAGPKR